MPKRVTLQDIADSLNLSRNTVSKAINNSSAVAESTKQLIFEKAAEMGYKQFSYFGVPDSAGIPAANGPNEIALLTENMFDSSHFGTYMIDKMQSELRKLGYGLTIYRLLADDINYNKLPPSFDRERICGILCMELFNYEYCKMLSELDIPMLSIDSPVAILNPPLKSDILLMENYQGIHSLISHLKDRGIRRFGFIGEIMHCRSFYERFCAVSDALRANELPYNPEFFLTAFSESSESRYLAHDQYLNLITKWLKNKNNLPECIICANDFVAIDIMNVLQSRGLKVPDDILVAGFDDSPDSRSVTPKLTSVHIHSQTMGATAVEVLFSRIKERNMAFRTVYIESELILRESTGD